MYSDLSAFGALPNAIGTYGYNTYGVDLTPHIANLALLASFYNMTASEIVDALDAASFNVQNIQFKTEGIPQYLEVLSAIPVFPEGYATVIIELQ